MAFLSSPSIPKGPCVNDRQSDEHGISMHQGLYRQCYARHSNELGVFPFCRTVHNRRIRQSHNMRFCPRKLIKSAGTSRCAFLCFCTVCLEGLCSCWGGQGECQDLGYGGHRRSQEARHGFWQGRGRSGVGEGKAELVIWRIYATEDEQRLLEKLHAMVMKGADKAVLESGNPW